MMPLDGNCPSFVVQPPTCPLDPTTCLPENPTPPPVCVESRDGSCVPTDPDLRGGGDGGGGDDCLRADSRVTLASGKTKTLGALKIGDMLQGPDGLAEVIGVNHLQNNDTLYYRINDLKFAITGDHPIETTTGWKAADDEMKYNRVVMGRLEVGDVLVTKNGNVEVTKITLEPSVKGMNAVNIRTRDDRAFYADGVVIKPFKDVTFTY